MLLNADEASIPVAKLRDFVLSESHRDNRDRWRLFAAIGFTQENWEEIADALRAQHLTNDAVASRSNSRGQLYTIVAPLVGPKGTANIKSVWQIDYGTEAPRFITAYGA